MKLLIFCFLFFPLLLFAQKKRYSLDYLFSGAVYQSNPWLGRFSYRTNPVWSYGVGIKANFLVYKNNTQLIGSSTYNKFQRQLNFGLGYQMSF